MSRAQQVEIEQRAIEEIVASVDAVPERRSWFSVLAEGLTSWP